MRLMFLIACLGSIASAELLEAKEPTPATNSSRWFGQIAHAPQQPRSGEAVRIAAQILPGMANVTLEYQVIEPGAYIELKDPAYKLNWTTLAMHPGEGGAEPTAYAAQIPGDVQKNRRLIRYRITASEATGERLIAPEPETMPNFAYFVYDGIPPWTGAIQPGSGNRNLSAPIVFGSAEMRRVQAYHLIARKSAVENVMWKEQAPGKEYRYTGALVADGIVYDHVGFRARGGVWRYSLGKNMWKFDMPNAQRLQPRDDFGRPYPVAWDKLNLLPCIQQGNYGHRGEQGMFETVGYRLFNLAGVAAPRTHWIQLRVVSEAEESPADQYRGDFWGLYLAAENEDGRFLKARGMPDGNVYKMFGGSGELQHQGEGQPANRADLFEFMGAYTRSQPPDDWWRKSLDLQSYYGYRAILECIHHYDIAEGKNYTYYHNPFTNRWQVFPWDIDLSWADSMYGSGAEPFVHRVLVRPQFRIEYQNRLREIRDLLFNPDQCGQLLDECADVISDPGGGNSIAEADRRKWDYHPAMGQGAWGWGGDKAGQGRFYQAAPTGNFRGMVQLMKNYVRQRGAWVDAALLNDATIPWTPALAYAGPAGYPAHQLQFRASAYKGSRVFAGMKWRIAEVTPLSSKPAAERTPRVYEITPVWESDEMNEGGREISIPPDAAKPGKTYRVRVRVKDVSGRWSHWSAPLEFKAGERQ